MQSAGVGGRVGEWGAGAEGGGASRSNPSPRRGSHVVPLLRSFLPQCKVH